MKSKRKHAYKKWCQARVYTVLSHLAYLIAYIQEAIDITREKVHLGVKLNGRKVDMLWLADDIAVRAENEEELQRMLKKFGRNAA